MKGGVKAPDVDIYEALNSVPKYVPKALCKLLPVLDADLDSGPGAFEIATPIAIG